MAAQSLGGGHPLSLMFHHLHPRFLVKITLIVHHSHLWQALAQSFEFASLLLELGALVQCLLLSLLILLLGEWEEVVQN